MRISEQDFELKIKSMLSNQQLPSASFEEKLFSSADVLLEKRREFIVARAFKREMMKRSGAAFSSFGKETVQRVAALLGQFVESFSSQPLVQAAAVLALFIIVFVNRAQSQKPIFTVADLPEFPKINNAPAKYEAMWLGERKAYDKEVEDARREPSDGI